MSLSARRAGFDRVLLDLNTQCDFLLPGGALPVANRTEVMLMVRKLMSWARTAQVPVISSLEAHRRGESLRGLPPHCLDRTLGQRKLPFTLLPNRILLMGDNTADLPMDPFRRFQQVIFTKRNPDFLCNPKADRLINGMTPDYWIIFGMTATHCVKAVTLGLLTRHHKVIVVRDACGYWAATDGEHAFRQMEAKGAMLVTTDDLVSGAVEDRIREHQLAAAARVEETDAAAAINFDPDESGEFAALRGPVGHANGNGNGNGHGKAREATSRGMPSENRCEANRAKSNGNGNGHAHGNGNGKSNGSGKSNGNGHHAPKAEKPSLNPERVIDFVAPELIRKPKAKAPAAARKPRRSNNG